MSTIIWTMLAFLLGAIPFSLWLGYLAERTDIRRYGDGNPGATNAWRAGGWRVGVPALLLDYLKGALPVGLAQFWVGISGLSLVLVALAPAFGHAYSPFLRWRGGKALAVTFGLWSGLTLAEGPIVLGLFLGFFYLVQTGDGWAVLLGMLAFGGYLLFRQGDSFLLLIWAVNALLLTWKYRVELRSAPKLQSWLVHIFGRQTVE